MGGLAVVLTGVVLSVGVAPAAAEDRIAIQDPGPHDAEAGYLSDVTAYAGTFAWTREVNDSADSRLVTRHAGRVQDARAGEFFTGLPGELDLGPGRGGPFVVYPRCDVEFSGGCDLFVYDIRGRRERKLSAAGHARRSENAGALWNGRLAFARTGSGPDGIFVTRPLRRLSRARVSDLDLRGSRVAWLSPDGKKLFTRRFNRAGGGRACLLARAGRGEVLGSLTLGSEYAFWNRQPVQNGSPGGPGSLHRRRLPGRRCEVRGRVQLGRAVPAGVFTNDSIAVDGPRAFYDDNKVIREMTDPPIAWR
jgi:hypothetical protein